ncbi:hypothetical protein [Kosakonia sp. S42]|uniref:hypothetical protein n=1 Tax=Kosakonia sp. S42 TaxID=2767458 RepID=UPI00190C5B51|nr:hypothetical protein [Kosakonia sp. S42]MBK0019508.1 hypothetical protein [Kosakonia sp. S42]
MINFRQIRDFALAMGYLAKTDRIDTRVLARIAKIIHSERKRFIMALPEAKRQVLATMAVRRRQLIAMLVTKCNHYIRFFCRKRKALIPSLER